MKIEISCCHRPTPCTSKSTRIGSRRSCGVSANTSTPQTRGVYCRLITSSVYGIAAWRITSSLRKWLSHGDARKASNIEQGEFEAHRRQIFRISVSIELDSNRVRLPGSSFPWKANREPVALPTAQAGRLSIQGFRRGCFNITLPCQAPLPFSPSRLRVGFLLGLAEPKPASRCICSRRGPAKRW
jgi:hypothetical protein